MSFLRFEPTVPASGWPDGSIAVLSRRRGDVLGVISYYSAWRQFVFEAKPDTVWSRGCLEDVRDKVDAMNAERRARRTA